MLNGRDSHRCCSTKGVQTLSVFVVAIIVACTSYCLCLLNTKNNYKYTSHDVPNVGSGPRGITTIATAYSTIVVVRRTRYSAVALVGSPRLHTPIVGVICNLGRAHQ